jgi:hypothetical protein
MPKKKTGHFGDLPPMYKFMLNPYPDHKVSRCPMCEGKTGQRKLPLLIHVDPRHLIALNYTNRYCQKCDVLIAHKHELEHYLTLMFAQAAPEVIGNNYFIIGTVEKPAWREGLNHPRDPREIIPYTHDFKMIYQELRSTRPGWYPEGVEPPIMEPPLSRKWVKF